LITENASAEAAMIEERPSAAAVMWNQSSPGRDLPP
jgi:hypothetical protein